MKYKDSNPFQRYLYITNLPSGLLPAHLSQILAHPPKPNGKRSRKRDTGVKLYVFISSSTSSPYVIQWAHQMVEYKYIQSPESPNDEYFPNRNRRRPVTYQIQKTLIILELSDA